MDFFSVLTLIGGLALFLYGMDVMGDGLKKLSGGKLESILNRFTSTRLKGFLLGLLVTAVIQSSSATTVMLVGFVNSGLMKLGQTISIIMGANVGTTVTAWILSSSGISGDSFFLQLLKPTSFTPILAMIGIILTFIAKNDKQKDIGTILLGFSVLIFGMDIMSGSMAGLKDDPNFAKLMIMFANPVMGILVGLVLTAIIQSSSASVGILQALSITTVIPFSTAWPVILGQNIGTTITPVLSSLKGNSSAKRVAFACVFIKIIGVLVVTIPFYVINHFYPFSFMNHAVTPFTIAVAHTIFNVLSTIVLLPFCKWIEMICVKAIKEDKKPHVAGAFDTLDERFLAVPSFAVEKCRTLAGDMATLAQNALSDASTLMNGFDEEKAKAIMATEGEIDKYEDKLGAYLVKLAQLPLSTKDSNHVTQLLHVIGDVERISDHTANIVEAIEEAHTKNLQFSENARHDIDVMSMAVCDIVDLTTRALINQDTELAKKVEPLEQVIDRLKRKSKSHHIQRLTEGGCTVELGFILSDLVTNYERISDHCSNIAACILEMSQGNFETHEYLKHIKDDNENSFMALYEEYKAKYTI